VGEHGKGTIVELPDGRYRVAVTMADGRRIWRRARTPDQAERIRAELVEARELELDPTRLTLSAFLRSWIASLRDAKRQRVAPRTLAHYAMIVERHIIPALGAYPLTRVTTRRVQAWLDADPASPQTVRHHHAVLRRAMNVAVRQRLMAYNPTAGVELPRPDWEGGDPLTFDEARRLLDTSRDDRLHALWRLALVTGLRQAELLGLAWEDVAGDQLVVRGQLQRLSGQWVRTRTKAARALDRIALDPVTVGVLEEHRRRQADERRPEWAYFGLVFVTAAGNPLHGSEVLRAFRAACDRAGISRRRFHDLRGTSATLLRALGVAEDARQARLGHATAKMARHYAQASAEQDRAAVLALSEALG
jgi:integrase